MRTCKCGKNEEQVPFPKNRRVSQCLECRKIYMKEYRKKNREKLSGQVQEWKDENREKHRATNRAAYHRDPQKHKARVTKTPRTWLGHLLSALKVHAKKPGKHDPKSGPKRDFDLDLDYLEAMWNEQEGKCALTGVPMKHEFNHLQSASVDRIDAEQGHVKGNIQLVCQCINMGKRHRTNAQMLEFLDELHAARGV